MKIENTQIFGFESAFRGMRNPFDSWDKSDSQFWPEYTKRSSNLFSAEMPTIGPNDLKLAKKLIKAGGDHRKFLRMIMVWVDITIPRYVWQELDTYKVATVRNSCSTMNKLGESDLEPHDFDPPISAVDLGHVNSLAEQFRHAKHAGNNEMISTLRVDMKGALPEGYLQKATYLMNYEVGLRILQSRGSHRLPHWRIGEPGSICEWILRWPYMNDFFEASKRKHGV